MNVLESFRLDGKAAYVTGGARGIGKTCAIGLAEAGADVAIADIDMAAAECVVKEIQALGRKAVAIQCDVAVSAQVDAMIAQVAAKLGRLDIALNNAGICVSAPAEEMTDAQWSKVIAVNLDSVFYCSRAAGAHMLKHGGGRIISIASMSAQIVNHPQPQCAYNASKAAVIQLSRSLASEWAMRGITVNTISPGYTGTELTLKMKELHGLWCRDTPMQRLATPDEIKGAAVFLASPAASFITGHDLVIDGGFTCW